MLIDDLKAEEAIKMPAQKGFGKAVIPGLPTMSRKVLSDVSCYPCAVILTTRNAVKGRKDL
jgi:hypothetical protein